MPVILTQHFAPEDRIYADAEMALYHYPRQYFSRIKPYDRFIYYRPLGRSRPRFDSKTYFGYGVLGNWCADTQRPDHRFVDLIQCERFLRLVPLRDVRERFYETESPEPPQFQSAVREISETAYYKILAAADVAIDRLRAMPSTESIAAMPFLSRQGVPKDRLREIIAIPGGAGYRPHADVIPDVYEAAALQERAREDHQGVLQLIQREVLSRGGVTFYNNNIDLFARIGERRLLIEGKSIVQRNAAIDQTRYGIGQLADYDYRYGEELERPQKVLAFGSMPPREVSWIGDLLQQERVAMVARNGNRLAALNAAAENLPIFG